MKYLPANLFRVALALAVAFVGPVYATAITYVDQAVATGTLGSNAFTNLLVTITFDGDTSNFTCLSTTVLCGTGVGTAIVTVAGIGTATFVTDSYGTFRDNSGALGKVGIGDFTDNASILDTQNPALAAYNLTTSVGPVSGTSLIRSDITFDTSLGSFNLQSVNGNTSTFSATIAPEPRSLALFSIGMLGILLLERRSRLLG